MSKIKIVSITREQLKLSVKRPAFQDKSHLINCTKISKLAAGWQTIAAIEDEARSCDVLGSHAHSATSLKANPA